MSKDTTKYINATFIICSLVCSVLIFTIYHKISNSDYSYLSSMGNNWENGPISSIAVAQKENCPNGYRPILKNTWSGTQEGCHCNIQKDKIFPGKCDRIALKNGCKDISAVPEKILNTWRGSKICGKISSSYLDLDIMEKSAKCSEGSKSCGTIDTVGNHLCVKEKAQCPINYMKVIGINTPLPIDRNYKFVNLGKEGKLIYSNADSNKSLFKESQKGKASKQVRSNKSKMKSVNKNQSKNSEEKENQVENQSLENDSKILAEFRIDDKTPCPSTKKRNIEHKPYLLEKSYGAEKCEDDTLEYFDQNFQKIDSITYQKLYNDNKITASLIQLPNFQSNNYLEMKTNLYGRNFIGVEKKCLNKILRFNTKEDLINNLKNIDSIFTDVYQYVFIAFILVLFSLSVIYLSIMTSLVETKIYESFKSALSIFYLIFLSTPLLSLTAYILKLLSNQNYDFSALTEPGCTDIVTLTHVNQFLSDINTFTILCIIAILFEFYAFFVNLILITLNSHGYKEFESSQENLEKKMEELGNSKEGNESTFIKNRKKQRSLIEKQLKQLKNPQDLKDSDIEKIYSLLNSREKDLYETALENGYSKKETLFFLKLQDIKGKNLFSELLKSKISSYHFKIFRNLSMDSVANTYQKYLHFEMNPFKTVEALKMEDLSHFQGNLPLDVFVMGCPCKGSFIEDDFSDEIEELKEIANEKGIKNISTEEIIEALAYIKREGIENGDLKYWLENKENMINKSELIKKEMKCEDKFLIVRCLFDAKGDSALCLKLLFEKVSC